MAKPPDIEKLRADTRDAAAALLDDMQHIREMIERAPPGPSRAETRRLSAILRRLVVDLDLHRVAVPRIGRIALLAPDMKPIVAFGLDTYFMMAVNLPFTSGLKPNTAQAHEDFARHMAVRVGFSVETFRKQPVICLKGVWVQRGAVIKYVANALSGVHSNRIERSLEEDLLDFARGAMTHTINPDKTISATLNLSFFEGGQEPPSYDPQTLDALLLELLSTAALISTSDDVVRLEDEIKKELGR